jgi:ESF2/ABP1 family protein
LCLATVGNKRPKHEKANYSEAWVEFLDKKMAKTVAEMLNAQVIGGKKGDR